MKNTAILDFDGTIYSKGFIDLGLLEKIQSEFEKIILVSNNSSISHIVIEKILEPYCKNILTPQLLVKAIMNTHSIKSEICCSEIVLNYLNSKNFSIHKEIKEVLRDYSLKASLGFIEKSELKKVGIVGKVSNIKLKKFLKFCFLNEYTLVGMNIDKSQDSHGLESSSNLVGDLYNFKYNLGKTSETYISLIKNYCNFFNLKPAVIFGDNFNSDGYLAKSLKISYKKVLFGKSEHSKIIKIF